MREASIDKKLSHPMLAPIPSMRQKRGKIFTAEEAA